MNTRFAKLLCLTVLAGLLAACGVKSQPVTPEGSTFPAQYPVPLPPLEAKSPKAGGGALRDDLPEGYWEYPNLPPGK